MSTTIGISPKLIAAVAVPLSAVASKVIISGVVDRVSLAAVVTIAIGGLAGYQAPPGDVAPSPELSDARLTPDPPDDGSEAL